MGSSSQIHYPLWAPAITNWLQHHHGSESCKLSSKVHIVAPLYSNEPYSATFALSAKLELNRNITLPYTMRKNILPNSQSDCREMTPLLHAMHFIHSPSHAPDRHYCSKSRAVGCLMWYEHIRNHFSKQYCCAP